MGNFEKFWVSFLGSWHKLHPSSHISPTLYIEACVWWRAVDTAGGTTRAGADVYEVLSEVAGIIPEAAEVRPSERLAGSLANPIFISIWVVFNLS